MRRRHSLLAAIVLALSLGSSRAAEPLELRLEGSRLWIHADAVAAVDLLAALSREAGIAFDLDDDVAGGVVTLDVAGLELEDGVRRVVNALPAASAHSFTYAADPPRRARLVAVRVFGPGRMERAVADRPVDVAAPTPTPLDPQERLERMIAAGLPRDTAEKVIELNDHARSIGQGGAEARITADELSAESRARLPELLDRGVPVDRALRMLRLQERYHETLAEIRRSRSR